MSVTKTDEGKYLVDIRPQGRNGKRYRKRFPTKSEAQQYERWLLSTQHDKGWVEKGPDRRPFAELIELWWEVKGQVMKTGVAARRDLIKIDKMLGHPTVEQLNKTTWTKYRAARVAKGLKPKSLNREQEMISSLFGTLIEFGHFYGENPFAGLSKMKVAPSEMGFLDKTEIAQLLAYLDGENQSAVRLSLATGARWGEVKKARRSHVGNERITFVDTKNGKNRTVPISKKLCDEILDGRVGLLFANADYLLIRDAIKHISPNLPDGQAVHVLRHTFASHFMMNGGNILTLQKILGHANIQQTMVYAHLAPEYLQEAVKFNPVEN
ncbi:integrase [Enterobacteriaceae bacterium ML5]|nr:integrase [Enterobacteriaceae bacterium ML5]